MSSGISPIFSLLSRRQIIPLGLENIVLVTTTPNSVTMNISDQILRRAMPTPVN
ncbi:hypothetical protein HRbin02_00523 [Candidatus Calditenuaceae archaeon HR02]|nr:hypothetical protein HRbin02_00523 [Candidatus Calditenuaceae archaeon HR02]